MIEILQVMLIPGLVGLGLWRLAVRPRLPTPDPTRDPAASPAEAPMLLGAFFVAWLLNAVLMIALAGVWAPEATEPVDAAIPAADVATEGADEPAGPQPDPSPGAPAPSLLETHGLAGVLGIQSTANAASVLALLGLLTLGARRRAMASALGLRRRDGSTWLAGLAAWLAFLPLLGVAVWLNTALLEEFAGSADKQAYLEAFTESLASRESAFVWIAMVVIIPVAEEVLYRGALFAGLRPMLGVWGAAVFSGLAFGLQHDPSAMLPTAALGVLLAWLRVRTGSLAVPVVVHMLQNGYTLTTTTLFSELAS